MEGYINGSDMLLAIGGTAVAHSTEHTVQYDTETKERAVKAPESVGVDVSVFKETSVNGLSITVSFKGLRNYASEETGFNALRDAWKARKPVVAECFHRKVNGNSDSKKRDPYLKANFVITKLTENNPAEDDASYDGELKMTGAPLVWLSAEEIEEICEYAPEPDSAPGNIAG